MRGTAGWIAIVAALSVAAAFSPLVTVAVIAAALVGSAWRWPNAALAAGALASLLLRPSLDMFSERRLNAGILTLEPAVPFGFAILLVGATGLLRPGRGWRPAMADRDSLRGARLPRGLGQGVAPGGRCRSRAAAGADLQPDRDPGARHGARRPAGAAAPSRRGSAHGGARRVAPGGVRAARLARRGRLHPGAVRRRLALERGVAGSGRRCLRELVHLAAH